MSKQTEYTVINAGHATARSQSLHYAVRDDARAGETLPDAVRTIALDTDSLDDEWFGSFDEEQPMDFVEEPSTWSRLSSWVRKRAA